MRVGGKLAARVIWYCNPENITEWENQEGPDMHNSSLHSVCIRGHHFCAAGCSVNILTQVEGGGFFFSHFSDSKHFNTS